MQAQARSCCLSFKLLQSSAACIVLVTYAMINELWNAKMEHEEYSKHRWGEQQEETNHIRRGSRCSHTSAAPSPHAAPGAASSGA